MSSQSPTVRQRARRLAGPLWVTGLGLCVLVLLIGLAGLAGWLEELPADDVPAAAADEVVEGEPWNVLVAQAGLASAEWAEPARLSDERNHWLVVIVEIEVTAPETRSDIRDAVVVRGIDGIERPDLLGPPRPDDIRMVRDSSSLPELHPGLPERLVFLWERDGSAAPPPAEIEIDVIGKVFRESSLGGRMEWLEPHPVARITLPLVDRRDPPPPGEDA